MPNGPMIQISNICTWDSIGVGTRVLNSMLLQSVIEGKLRDGKLRMDAHGHFYIHLDEYKDLVSCGVGPHTNNPSDYVLRSYRGKVEAYLSREKAAPVESLGVIVYTRMAYLSDPDVLKDPEEIKRVECSDCTHIVVCVLASAGPKAPVAPRRFCANLAGGNPEWKDYSKETLVSMAKETTEYHEQWCTVSD